MSTVIKHFNKNGTFAGRGFHYNDRRFPSSEAWDLYDEKGKLIHKGKKQYSSLLFFIIINIHLVFILKLTKIPAKPFKVLKNCKEIKPVYNFVIPYISIN